MCFLIQSPPYPAHLQHGPSLALPVTPHRPALSGARHGAALPSGAQDSHPSPPARTEADAHIIVFMWLLLLLSIWVRELMQDGMLKTNKQKKTPQILVNLILKPLSVSLLSLNVYITFF